MEKKVIFQKAAKVKPMIQVSIDGKDEWCNATPAVAGFAKKALKPKTEVTITYEDGELKNITRIDTGRAPAVKTVAKVEPNPAVVEPKVTPPEDPIKGDYKPYKKEFDASLSLKQTAVNATAATLASMPNQFTIKEFPDLADTIFTVYVNLLKLEV